MKIQPQSLSSAAIPSALADENVALKEQVKTLQQQVDWFKRQLFGQKSEKRAIDGNDQLQLDLLGGDAGILKPAVETEEIQYTRKKQRSDQDVNDTGLRFTDDVPVEVIEMKASQLQGPDADQWEVIDHKVTYRLAQRPGSYVVIEYRRPVLRHVASHGLVTTAAPPAIFDNSLADVSLLAGLIVDKFLYHLPLYRQHQRLKDAGITLSRTTLTHYVRRSIQLLAAIYQAQLKNILLSKVLAMDETPIKAGRKQKGKMNTTWFWPIYGEQDEICFTWSKSRGSAHVFEQLEGFKGILLTDGYAAYERYVKSNPESEQAQCWTHTRRYFERAKESDSAAAEALTQIGELYRIEEEIRDQALQGEAKLHHRIEHAKPRVEAFFGWCRQQRQRTDIVNSDLISKALLYVGNRIEPLQVYLRNPDVQIDTNHIERGLRVIPMGRKNWLFAWTEAGAEEVGMIQSLLVTCRMHGVNPYTYLVDVLQRVSLIPNRDVEQLTPRRWKELFADRPLKSDLSNLG